MKKLWDKSEIGFAVLFIIVYVVGNSLLMSASNAIGMEMALTLPFNLALIAVMLAFVRRNNLLEYYGIRAPGATARQMLFYIPLAIVATVNIWFGVAFNLGFTAGLVYFLAMIATGVAEELIFRGLLFRAMSRKNVRSAIILTSVLFGAGHIVNLINGSGATLLENLCQVAYAIAIGFLLVAALIRSKSLIPCMITHAAFNALSVFANTAVIDKYQIAVSVSLCVISAAAAAWYLRHSELQK